MHIPLLVFLYILVPLLLIYAEMHVKWVKKIGPVLLAYAAGLLLGNVGWLPEPSDFMTELMHGQQKLTHETVMHMLGQHKISMSDVVVFKVSHLQEIVSTVTVPLSISLLLFSLNVRQWFRIAGKTMLSMVIAIITVLGLILLCATVFFDNIENIDKISGMLVGLYTGGTPNLASLSMILKVDADTYILTHTYDSLISFTYLMFLITIGKVIFRKWLGTNDLFLNSGKTLTAHDIDYRRERKITPIWQDASVSVFLSALVFALAGGVSLLVPESAQMLVVILTITTFSILLSLIHQVNKLRTSYHLGMYFILVFSMVIASKADLDKILHISGPLLTMIVVVIFGTLLVHAFLCRLFKIDADTLIITSTALICSPPFVPMMAGALNNRNIIVPGLTVGIIGYAVGNYLGTILYFLLAKLI